MMDVMTNDLAMTAVDFLRLILPDQGFKCVVIKTPNGGVRRQRFTESFEEMARWLIGASRQGYNAYHACASFKTTENRKQENALGCKSLWADVDTREGKPDAIYVDREEAYHATLAFCAVAKLPRPLFVCSGYGIHLYWPWLTVLNIEAWRALACGLKALAVLHKFHIDPARTADCSSILRTPGTWNFK
jgi:hypothetical protein